MTPKRDEKKKKKAKNRGTLADSALENSAERAKAEKGRDRLLKRLLGSEDQPELTSQTESHAAGQPETAELTADQLETLSPDEELLVTRQLVQARQEEAVEQGDTVTSDGLAAAAIEEFRERILAANETVEQAAAAVLEELSIELPPESAATAEAGGDIATNERLSVEAVPQEFAESEEVVELRSPKLTTAGRQIRPADPGLYSQSPLMPDRFPTAGMAETPSTLARYEQTTGYDKSDVVGAALVSGLVGYLIGRRRGRIKTEKRLLPVQKKLENRVNNLRQHIERQEFTIRQTANEQARRQITEMSQRNREKAAFIARINALKDRDTRATESLPSLDSSRQERKQIGQVLITAAETPSAERPRPATAIEQAPVLSLDKHVETLSQKDLLELSGKIIVEGTSLRQIYESHQVGEKALRRLVSEHLRGGDVRQTLRNELTQHEIDFERDPQLRDRTQQTPGSSMAKGGGALQALIQRADATVGRQDDEARAVLEARAAYQLKERAQTERQQRLINISLISIIAVLLTLVVLLIITRSS